MPETNAHTRVEHLIEVSMGEKYWSFRNAQQTFQAYHPR
jgi:hypothetical protein